MPDLKQHVRQSFPLVITLAIQAMVTIAITAVPAIAPVVAKALGVSAAYTGLYVGMVYTGAILAGLAAGGLVRRFGAIRVSQGGLLVSAAGLALTATGFIPAVAIGALLMGFGYGPATPASSHLLARTTAPHRMSLVFSLKQTGVPLGGAVAGAVVPALALLAGWQYAMLAIAAANLLCMAAAQPLRAELDADRVEGLALSLGQLQEPVRLLLADPARARFVACAFVFSVTQLSLVSYLVTYLTDSLGYTLVAAGLALTVTQVGGVAGRVLWGYVADRWLNPRTVLAALAAVMFAATLATALLPAPLAPVAVLAILLVFGASAIGWNGVYLAEVVRQAPPGTAASVTGATLAFTLFGAVVGPPLFGALSAWCGSYRAGFAALAVPLGLCFWTLLQLRRPAVARA